jgi:hypothetical protein
MRKTTSSKCPDHQSPITHHPSPITHHPSPITVPLTDRTLGSFIISFVQPSTGHAPQIKPPNSTHAMRPYHFRCALNGDETARNSSALSTTGRPERKDSANTSLPRSFRLPEVRDSNNRYTSVAERPHQTREYSLSWSRPRQPPKSTQICSAWSKFLDPDRVERKAAIVWLPCANLPEPVQGLGFRV